MPSTPTLSPRVVLVHRHTEREEIIRQAGTWGQAQYIQRSMTRWTAPVTGSARAYASSVAQTPLNVQVERTISNGAATRAGTAAAHGAAAGRGTAAPDASLARTASAVTGERGGAAGPACTGHRQDAASISPLGRDDPARSHAGSPGAIQGLSPVQGGLPSLADADAGGHAAPRAAQSPGGFGPTAAAGNQQRNPDQLPDAHESSVLPLQGRRPR